MSQPQIPLLTMDIGDEQDIVLARQRIRLIARRLGFETGDQAGLTAAVSEAAWKAWEHGGGKIDFLVEGLSAPQKLLVRVYISAAGMADWPALPLEPVADKAAGDPSQAAAGQLLDIYHVESATGQVTAVWLGKTLPPGSSPIGQSELAGLADEAAGSATSSMLEELRQQDQALWRSLDEQYHSQQALQRLHRELEDTNRGVVALYAELDEAVTRLRLARAELENRVRERTAELETANVILQEEIEERRRAEEAIRRLAAIVESADEAIVGKTTEGIIVSWNTAAERLYGYPAAEMIGQSIFHLAPPGRREELTRILEQINQGQHVEHLETERVRKDGSVIAVSVTISPICDATGSITGASSIAHDVTELKRAEAALRLANHYNRSLIEASPDPLVTITPEGKIGDVNAATERATGCPRAELIGADFSDYFTDPDQARAGYQRVFTQGVVRDYALDLRHTDGHTTSVLYNASVYKDEAGQVLGVFAAARDITKRKQAEAKRAEEHAILSAILESAESPIFALDRSYRYIAFNHMHAQMMRDLYGADIRVGDSLLERMTIPLDRETTRQNVDRALAGQALVEAAYSGGDGPSQRYFEVAHNPIYNEAGAIIGVSVFAKDLTDRKRAEDEIRRLNRDLEGALAQEKAVRQQLIQAEKLSALGRMVGSVAHELNNPLQTIRNCLYLAGQETAADLPVHECLEMAESETQRLMDLVAQLRELYRMRPTIAPSVHALDGLLQDVRRLMAAQLQDAHVEWRQPANLPSYRVNVIQDRLKQVFINLITNALEAMRPGGGELRVGVTPSADSRQVGIVFHDTGPGIESEHLSHLFEPFFTTKVQGLGLGLAICYEIVQQHGGQMTVESQPGQGAQFTVWLPLANGIDAD